VHGWTAACGRQAGASLDEFGILQGLEMLADGGVGEAEFGGEFGCRDGFDALQALEDTALGAGEVVSAG
jgi:hypothetical protein